MALSDDDRALLRRLQLQLQQQRPELERLDRYYEGEQRLQSLGIAVPPQLERFVTIVNWPAITVDSIEQRLDVEGFRIGAAPPADDVDPAGPLPVLDPDQGEDADDDLWELWQANDLDEESQQGQHEAIALSRAYSCVGTRSLDDPDPDFPLITVESPFEMTHLADPRTRQVMAALKLTPAVGTVREQATLYLPGATRWLERSGRGWTEVERDEHGVEVPLVTPLVNRPRLRRRGGASEMRDVIGLTDAACRALTNAQVATEVLAVPQRYVLGAAPEDFVDADGKPVPAWEAYYSAVWALQNDQAKVGQFDAADLSNFVKIVDHYANLVSGVSGLPTRFYGQYTTNPPSEGSIVADESRLIMNAYRKQRAFGGSWERTIRLARRVQDGGWDPRLRRLETLWRSPETPTQAQLADAVVKLRGANLLPDEAAWEELGYSATRRRQLRAMRDRDVAAAAARQAEIAPAAAGEPAPPAPEPAAASA